MRRVIYVAVIMRISPAHEESSNGTQIVFSGYMKASCWSIVSTMYPIIFTGFPEDQILTFCFYRNTHIATVPRHTRLAKFHSVSQIEDTVRRLFQLYRTKKL